MMCLLLLELQRDELKEHSILKNLVENRKEVASERWEKPVSNIPKMPEDEKISWVGGV